MVYFVRRCPTLLSSGIAGFVGLLLLLLGSWSLWLIDIRLLAGFQFLSRSTCLWTRCSLRLSWLFVLSLIYSLVWFHTQGARSPFSLCCCRSAGSSGYLPRGNSAKSPLMAVVGGTDA